MTKIFYFHNYYKKKCKKIVEFCWRRKKTTILAENIINSKNKRHKKLS